MQIWAKVQVTENHAKSCGVQCKIRVKLIAAEKVENLNMKIVSLYECWSQMLILVLHNSWTTLSELNCALSIGSHRSQFYSNQVKR